MIFSSVLGWAGLERKAIRRLLLGVSLAVNLGLLVGLKLVPLLTPGRFAWLFTLSLSFYCFQSLTYTIDLYFGEMQPTRSYSVLPGIGAVFPIHDGGADSAPRQAAGAVCPALLVYR